MARSSSFDFRGASGNLVQTLGGRSGRVSFEEAAAVVVGRLKEGDEPSTGTIRSTLALVYAQGRITG